MTSLRAGGLNCLLVYGRGLSCIFELLFSSKKSEVASKRLSHLLPLHLDALSFSAQEQVGFLCFGGWFFVVVLFALFVLVFLNVASL